MNWGVEVDVEHLVVNVKNRTINSNLFVWRESMKKKVVKIIGIVMLSFILAYTLFIVEESIRLSNNSLAEPLIVF